MKKPEILSPDSGPSKTSIMTLATPDQTRGSLNELCHDIFTHFFPCTKSRMEGNRNITVY